MTGSFSQHPYCLTCQKRVDGFQSQHESLGHRVSVYTFGGYKPVEERREVVLEIKPEERKIKADWLEAWEDEEPDQAEGA